MLTGTPVPTLPPASEERSAGGAAAGQPETVYGRVVHSKEVLEGMTLKALKELCRCRKLVMAGRKDDLVARLLTSQLGPYPDGAAGP